MKQFLIIASLSTLLFFSCTKNNSERAVETFKENNYDTFNKPKLDSLFDILYQNDKFMGNISLSHKGTVIYSKSIGFDDIETQKASTPETKYRIGSIAKMFTATLVFIAIEENKIDLNQTIETYFPAIENTENITVGNLLNHRSGIRSFTKDEAFWAYRTEHKSSEEMVEIISAYKSNFQPNSKSEYSNSNYLLLSVMLEKLYNSRYDNLIAEKITSPLKLNNTYHGGKISIADNESNSYNYTTEWVKQIETDLSVTMGAGSLVSSAKDLNKFIEALFNETIISKESLDMMTSIEDNFGRGIMEFSFKDHTGYGHGGNIDGFNAKSIYFPKEELAIALTSNAIDYNINSVVMDVLKCYFDEPFELPNFEQIEIKASELEKYVGYYVGDGGGSFTISQKNNTLYAQLDDFPKEPLVYKGNDVFTNEEIGANFIFNLQKNQLGLEQNGVADIYLFTKQ
ncbi:MAG: beta-lactamase family protein [Balneolaceae bacterium]|nr:beta-lactamase family protein [Balneolaceae bacterium]